MKKKIFTFFTLIFLTSVVSLSAHEDNCSCLSSRDYSCFEFQEGDKVYINEEYLLIDEGKIFLNVGGNLMQVQSLFTDLSGIYLSAKGEARQGWTCPICGTYNPPDRMICINANKHWDFD